MTAAGMELCWGTRRKQGWWMLGEVQRRLPGWHIEKRGETGRSWVRKREQKDVSCSIPLGSDSGVALCSLSCREVTLI